MANEHQAPALIGLVEVLFVGGPFHAHRIGMANPEFLIDFQLDSGERFQYCRRLVEAELRQGTYINIATYAPTGISDEEFARLAVDAARSSVPG